MAARRRQGKAGKRDRREPAAPTTPAAPTAPAVAVSDRLRCAIAVLGGVALAFSFAPFEWWWLAPVSLATLYVLIQNRPGRRAGLIGWCFGLGYFGFGVYWIYYSVHLFGAAIAPLAALITAVFVLVMTVFPALTAAVFARLSVPARPIQDAMVFTALWVLSELARGAIMGGFPWILVGYSQTGGPLGHLAPILGAYGLSLLVVLLSTLLVPLLMPPAWRAGESLSTRAIAAGCWVCLPLLAQLAAALSWSTPKENTLSVRLVQGNIPQEMKFSAERLQTALDLYVSMTLKNLHDIDLVIWPETAIPTYLDRVEPVLGNFVERIDAAGVEVLSGVFVREGERVYNSVHQLGGEQATYRKRRLVPFGEYMPLRFIFDYAARFVDIPMSDLSADVSPHRPLSIHGEKIGVSICYEDVYGDDIRGVLPEATLLVNVSNDAWFGDSAAPWQHEQKARMRARELARPLIRVTNTGVSSAIDHHGRVLGRIDHDTQGILDIQVTPRTGLTPYARMGDWPVILLALLVATFGLASGLARGVFARGSA